MVAKLVLCLVVSLAEQSVVNLVYMMVDGMVDQLVPTKAA